MSLKTYKNFSLKWFMPLLFFVGRYEKHSLNAVHRATQRDYIRTTYDDITRQI